MKRIAIIGTQGIPAHYGGFETLAENLVTQKHDAEIDYTVYCSSKDLTTRPETYHGAHLKYVGLHSNGMQSIVYDIVCMLKSVRGYDALLILGVSGCIFIPLLKLLTRSKIVINIDGLEHKRQKWSKFAKWFLKLSEKMAVKYADTVIADNQGIKDYVAETYHKEAELIAYGGDQALVDVTDDHQQGFLEHFNLKKGNYALSICRIEPENNVEMILETFAKTGGEFAIVGNFENSDYAKKVKNKFVNYKNIHIIDACYDLQILFSLRNNASYYVHGHSAGGTNPSLVEIMQFGIPIVAYDVNYNRYTTSNVAEYFSNADELEALVKQPRIPSGAALKQVATRNYRWNVIAEAYEKVLCTFNE